MYKYFVPDDPDGGTIVSFSEKVPSVHPRGDIVPIYDDNGRFIATFILLLF